MIGDAMKERILDSRDKDLRSHIHHLASNLKEVIRRTVAMTNIKEVIVSVAMKTRVITARILTMPTGLRPTITNREDQIDLKEMMTLLIEMADIRERETGWIDPWAEIIDMTMIYMTTPEIITSVLLLLLTRNQTEDEITTMMLLRAGATNLSG
jgi:hypothetical protein